MLKEWNNIFYIKNFLSYKMMCNIAIMIYFY